MKIRHLALAAGTSLLVGLMAGSVTPVYAVAEPTVTLNDAPTVLGDGRPPVEFSATVADAGEGARLRFGAAAVPGLLFGPSAIVLEFQGSDGAWQRIDLTSADPTIELSGGTVGLRLGFDSGQNTEPPTSGPGDPPPPPDCSDLVFGFSLTATLVDGEQEVASDQATTHVSNASARVHGLQGAKIVAGRASHPFTVDICNDTDSAYTDLAIAMSIVRGSIDSGPDQFQWGPSQVILETSPDGVTWQPVELHRSDEGPPFLLSTECGPRLDLPPRTTGTPVHFRLGFTLDVKPTGPGFAPGTLRASSCGASGDLVEFEVHPPSTQTPPPSPPPDGGPELPPTGAGFAWLSTVLGACLVVLGVGLVVIGYTLRIRRRPQ